MRVLLIVILVLTTLALCAAGLVLAAVGMGYGLSRLLPLTLFQLSTLSFLALCAVLGTVAWLLVTTAPRRHDAVDDTPFSTSLSDEAEQPHTRATVLTLVEEIVDIPRRPRRRSRASRGGT